MKLILFNWKTNLDYIDMLSRESFITDSIINKSKLKRLIAKLKRKLSFKK